MLEYEREILESFQKELGGHIDKHPSGSFSLRGNDNTSNYYDRWCLEVRRWQLHDSEKDGIYRIWAWKSGAQTVSLIVSLSDPSCHQKIIDHINEAR